MDRDRCSAPRGPHCPLSTTEAVTMLFRPLLHGQAARRLPIPVNFRERPALELDGFSEYAAEITPDQRKAIDALALEIVKSNDTNNPIFEFRVEGFADKARRIVDQVER